MKMFLSANRKGEMGIQGLPGTPFHQEPERKRDGEGEGAGREEGAAPG